jgi:hypothetical protein
MFMTKYVIEKLSVKNSQTQLVRWNVNFFLNNCIVTGYIYKNLVWWIKYSRALFKEIEF